MSDYFDLLSVILHCWMLKWQCRGFSGYLQGVNPPDMCECPGTGLSWVAVTVLGLTFQGSFFLHLFLKLYGGGQKV